MNLELLYKLYPRKLGKTEGLKKAKRVIKSEADYEALKQAILNFREHCKREGTESRYIPYFSTFMNSWEDWLDEDAGLAEVFEVEIKRRSILEILK